MQVTEEQLKAFPEEDRPWVRKALTNQRNPKATALKQEIHDWAYEKYEKNELPFRWNDLITAVHTVIKLRLNLKNILTLTDEQAPEARAIFEKFKEDFDV